MINSNKNVNTVAETLKKCGLVTSTNEAVRMAQDIVKTDSKVSKDFDKKKTKIDKRLEDKKYGSYQEEIDDLIKKTDFNTKDYFIPVSGFKKEKVVTSEKTEKYPEDNIKKQEIKLKVERKEKQEINREEKVTQEKEKTSKKIQSVYRDKFDDETTLKELMMEDAEKIYKKPLEEEEMPEENFDEEDSFSQDINKVHEKSQETELNIDNEIQEVPEKENIEKKEIAEEKEEDMNEYNLVFLDNSSEVQESEDLETIPEEKEVKESSSEDEFIIDIEEGSEESGLDKLEETESQPENQRDQSEEHLSTAKENDDKKEQDQSPKKEIPKVDLMDHFNFGNR